MRFAFTLLYLASSLIRIIILLIRPGLPPLNFLISISRFVYSLINAAYTFILPEYSVKKWHKALLYLKSWLRKLEQIVDKKKTELDQRPGPHQQKASLAYLERILAKCNQLIASFEQSLLKLETKEKR